MASYLPYQAGIGGSQVTLGHYALGQKSGALTGTIAAASAFASFRWAPSITAYAAIIRIKIAQLITTVLSTATPADFSAQISRGFTVDWSANMTQANMAAKVSTGAMRSNMPNSQMGAKGPQVITTIAPTG